MELTVNEILYDEITKLDYTLIPPGYHGDARALRLLQDNLAKIIDHIGEQSAAAQGLNRVITTAEKLRNCPDNTLFLLKDARCNQGDGALIGLLKVGYKKLFLFDPRNKVREVEPLCVLDFFIAQDHQRVGYGRILFDYMLQALEVHPYELAIDGPSSKMEQFLAKNYGIDDLVRQNNNFAVAAQFFDNVVDISNKSGRSTPAIVAAVGRFAAPKPQSAIANVIHGGTPYYNDPNNGPARGRDLYDSRHISDVWKQTLYGAGDNMEREHEREEEVSALLSDEVKPAEQQPSEYQEDDPYWDYEDHIRIEKEKAEREGEEKQEGTQPASSERPSTLHVEPPAAPAAFADVPAAGLPSGANTPSFGASGGVRRDSQLTEKGYFDVKFYHNRLCSSSGLYTSEAVASTVGRFAATQPASDIASVIHGDTNSRDDFYSGWEPAPPAEEEEEEDLTALWDYEEYVELLKAKKEMENAKKQEGTQPASSERPSTLHVEPPAAPAAFADVPAAGLPSGANTPSFGASGGTRRDSQKTEKGYNDVKYYHNRLW